MERPSVLILGKLPPPFMGPAVATKILLESELKDRFNLSHFDTRINENLADIGAIRLSKFSAIRKLYKDFRLSVGRIKPQVVLVPIGQTTAGLFKDLPFIRMAAATGAKVLVQLRGSEFRDWYNALDSIRKAFVINQLKKASGAIVLGENLRYIFDGLFPVHRIFVVPNGGDYTFPERQNHTLRITYLANYLPGKGIHELLEALSIMSQNDGLPAFEFHAHGSWNSDSYKRDCMAIANSMNHVHIHGSISGAEKWQVLADTDVFAFAPKSPEGHPWSLVEAMAAGLPIVSTDRGAISQSIVDGKNGFLLPNPEPAELATSISKLLMDANLRREMGIASRGLYTAQFTGAVMAGRMGDVFDEIILSTDD